MPSIWIASRSRSSSRVSIHAFMRAADNATKRRNVALGQPDRTLETPRRDVDQHLVHRPFAEQVFADGVLPTRQYALGPVEPANPWALDLDLATVKADLAFGPPPAVRLASLTPLVALATDRRRILLQHLAQRLEPGGKAKAFKARRHARQRLGLQRIGGKCGRRGMLLHGVALLSWNQHPEPKGSRRATPLLPFQHSSGQPPPRDNPANRRPYGECRIKVIARRCGHCHWRIRPS